MNTRKVQNFEPMIISGVLVEVEGVIKRFTHSAYEQHKTNLGEHSARPSFMNARGVLVIGAEKYYPSKKSGQ